MNTREIFEAYEEDGRSWKAHGLKVESLPYFVRHTPLLPDAEGMIVFTDLPPGCEDEMIDGQILHFAKLGRDFEWKVYDLDRPADLRARLERRGFVGNDVEAFMVLPLDKLPALAARATHVEIRRVLDENGVRDVVSVQESVWEGSHASWGQALLGALEHTPDEISIYVAFVDGRPVATGRVDLPKNSRFAGIYGGCVLEEFRGRGIYSALFQHRAIEARERGYAFLTVDAAPMSRPILLRKGFTYICETRPMRLPRATQVTES